MLVNTKLVAQINTELMNKKIETAIEAFKSMESQLLHDVDLEKCIKSYLDAIFIYDARLVTVKAPLS